MRAQMAYKNGSNVPQILSIFAVDRQLNDGSTQQLQTRARNLKFFSI